MLRPSCEIRHWPSDFNYRLGWNAYLLFNTDIVNLVWKTDEGVAESIAFLIFVLWWCLNLRLMRGGGVGQKVLFMTS